MKIKKYSPEEVLMAVIEYYANHHCKDFDESVEAFFTDDEGSVEIEISLDKNPANDTKAPAKKKSKKSLN